MKINIINACSDLGVNVDGSRYSPIKVKEYLKNSNKINTSSYLLNERSVLL